MPPSSTRSVSPSIGSLPSASINAIGPPAAAPYALQRSAAPAPRMDSLEPDTPFAAVSAQTTKLGRVYQAYLDRSTPFYWHRWAGTGVLFVLFGLRIFLAQGWYIVAYSLGIYLLNLFLAFLSPKFDPSLDADDYADAVADNLEGGILSNGGAGKGGGAGSNGGAGAGRLPTKEEDEFRPFVRRLPEFQFWYAATRAVAVAFVASWLEFCNLPVFWPVLVVYWFILFTLTMRRQIQHMIKYRYVPFTRGKTRYPGASK